MKLSCRPILILIAAATLLLHADLGADEKKKPDGDKKKDTVKSLVVEGELINVDLRDNVTQSYAKTFTYKMEKDKTYQIDLSSKNFFPYLRLEDAKGTQVDTGVGQPASMVYKAAKTEDYQIVVTSQNQGTGKFTLTVKDGAASMVLSVKEKLGQNDMAYMNRKGKLILVNLEAGKTYQIDMRSTDLDSYLYLESPAKKLLAQDDDGGGFPNARIIYKATETGKFRIIASHFDGKFGEFTVTVRQTDGPAPAQIEKRRLGSK